MGLRDIGSSLPPGFRFYPSDEELISHYLYKKIANQEVIKGTLVEIDLHTCEPWQLPGKFLYSKFTDLTNNRFFMTCSSPSSRFVICTFRIY